MSPVTGVPAGAFVEPAYHGRSLGDVVPAVAAALGQPIEEPPPGLVLPDAGSYVVFLVDGLGAELLRRHASYAPYLARLLDYSEPGTAGVPSTTATSLASLGTALVPGAHGLVGFTSRVPGTDQLLNALLWDRDVDPVQWQPHPTAFARLRARGVTVTVVNKRAFSGSGLTVAAHRGRGLRRRRQGGGADRGRGALGPRAAGADLPLRRRPRLDRAPVRRRLQPVAPAAVHGRRGGRAAARGAARRRPG